MLTAPHEGSRGRTWQSAHGIVLPEVDPTDHTGADMQQVAQPERRLLFAILADAIVRFRRLAIAPRHASRELMESERWIRSDDREWPCSFVNVCDALDIAYGPLRRAVLAWRRASDPQTRVTRRGLLVKNKRQTTRPRLAEPVLRSAPSGNDVDAQRRVQMIVDAALAADALPLAAQG